MENKSNANVGRYIDLMFDRGFKRVFGKPANKDVLIAFLNTVIPEKNIVDLTYLNVEKEGLGPDSRKSCFDVHCTIDDGSHIIVEVQNSNQAFYRERVLYYASLPVLDQIEKGEEYNLTPVYVVSILNFSLPHENWDGAVRSSYTIREDRTGEAMTDALHFIFLELGRFTKTEHELDNDLEKWYFCLLHMGGFTERPAGMQAEVFRRLFNVAEVEALPAKEREQYIKDMTTERDIRNQKAFARNEGMKEGLKEGLERGEAKKQLEVAKAMLSKGMAPTLISEITGLSLDQVLSLDN